MNQTYLTTQELSDRIKYDARTIRERLKDLGAARKHPLYPPVWWSQDLVYLGSH